MPFEWSPNYSNETSLTDLMANSILQTMIASYPSYLDVQGAVVVEENPKSGEIIWKWKIVEPTQLRLDPEYAQV